MDTIGLVLFLPVGIYDTINRVNALWEGYKDSSSRVYGTSKRGIWTPVKGFMAYI